MATYATSMVCASDSFSISFGSERNSASVSGSESIGLVGVTADNWNNARSGSGTITNLKDNEGNETSASASWAGAAGTWSAGGTPTNESERLMLGYLAGDYEAAGKVQINFSDIPFLVSDVYIVTSSNKANTKMVNVVVNGIGYMGDGSSTIQGSDNWGTLPTNITDTLKEGVNYLKVTGITDSNINIYNGTKGNSSSSDRVSCDIGYIQVVNAYFGTRRDLTLTDNASWTGSGSTTDWSPVDSSGAWINSSEDAGYYAYITSNVEGGSLITIADGESNIVTTDAVVLGSASTSDLTISGGDLYLTGPGILRVDSHDRSMTINSTLHGDITVAGVGKTIFGTDQNISSLQGAGNLDIGSTSLTVNIAGGTTSSFLGKVFGSGTIVKSGTGTQFFNTNLADYTGGFNIIDGTLQFGDSTNKLASFNHNVTAAAGKTIAFNMESGTAKSGNATINLGDGFAGNVIIQSGTFGINVDGSDTVSNIGTGKLIMENGTYITARKGATDGQTLLFENDIHLNGRLNVAASDSSGFDLTLSGNVTGSEGAIFEKGYNGNLTLTGDWSNYGGVFYNNQYGTVNLTGGDKVFSDLQLAERAAINIYDGKVSVSTLVTSNTVWSSTGNDLNILRGGLLQITGTKTDDSKPEPHQGVNSILIGRWTGDTRFNIDEGAYIATGAVTQIGNNASSANTVTVTNGGQMNAMGINMRTDKSSLIVTGGGMLNLGSRGLYGTAGTVTFSGGILGALNETGWTSSRNIVLSGGGNALTVNTGRYAINEADVFSSQYTADGTQIVLNGAITGTGNIVKTGAGTLVLSGTNTFDGQVHLHEGTLSVNNAAMGAEGARYLHILAGSNGSAAPIILADGGTLTLNGFTMEDGASLNLGGFNTANTLRTTGDVTLSNGTLAFSTGDRFEIGGNIEVIGELTFTMSLAGYQTGNQIILGSVAGNVNDLSKLLFRNTNAGSSDYRSSQASISLEGNMLIATVTGGSQNLQWTSANTAWDVKATGNWQGSDGIFWQGDNVAFGDLAEESKTIQVSGSVLPGNMTLSNTTTDYTFTGGSITVSGAFEKTGSGLWILGSGTSLSLQGSTSIAQNTLSLAGGSLDLSGIMESSVNLGILQQVTAGSTINIGGKTLLVGVAGESHARNMSILGTGKIQAVGSHALHFSTVTASLYAGAAGLNIVGNTLENIGNIGIYGGAIDGQTMGSGDITIGSLTENTTLDFGAALSQNSRGIFGAASTLGDSGNITTDPLTNIRIIGTRNGETSTTTITGRIYGGGAQGVDIYGSTNLSLDGIRFNGSGSKVEDGVGVLIAAGGIGSNVWGNADLSVNDSYIDSIVYGTAGNVGGNIAMTFSNSIMNQTVYAGGYASSSVIGGDTSLIATGTTFNAGILGGYDGKTTGKMVIDLTGSTVKGDVYAGYSVFTSGVSKITGGADIVIHDTTVTGTVGLSTRGGGKADLSNIEGDSTITISGNSVVGNVMGLGQTYGGLIGNLTIFIKDNAVIGEGKTGQDTTATFYVGNQDGAMTGNATLDVSGGTIKNEYLAFASIGNTGINGDAKLRMTGGVIESNIRAAGTWNSVLNGNFDIEISGGTLGKAGATRSIIGGSDMSYSDNKSNRVTGNVSIKLDGGIDGKGAAFLGDYYIHAGSRADRGNVAGNTLVTLSNVTALGGVSAMSGVISGANAEGTGVGGTERKLVFDHYTVETNAQFQYFTLAEVINRSNVTLKGISANIDAWKIEEGSTLTAGGIAKLGVPSTVKLEGTASTLNLALEADDTMGATTLTGNGSFNVSGNRTLTVSADNTAFNGTTNIRSGATTALSGNGTLGNSAINLENQAKLAFNRTNNYTVATGNVISGQGSVEQRGSGTTTITHDNTFTGGTVVTAGTLIAASENALGGLAGSLHIQGGALKIDTAILNAGDVTISGGSLYLGAAIPGPEARGVLADSPIPVTLSLAAGADFVMTGGDLYLNFISGGVSDKIVGNGGSFTATGGILHLVNFNYESEDFNYRILEGFSPGLIDISNMQIVGYDAENWAASIDSNGFLSFELAGNIPEPSSVALVGLAALGLGIRRKRLA